MHDTETKKVKELNSRLYVRMSSDMLARLDAFIRGSQLVSFGMDRSALIRWLIDLLVSDKSDQEILDELRRTREERGKV